MVEFEDCGNGVLHLNVRDYSGEGKSRVLAETLSAYLSVHKDQQVIVIVPSTTYHGETTGYTVVVGLV